MAWLAAVISGKMRKFAQNFTTKELILESTLQYAYS